MGASAPQQRAVRDSNADQVENVRLLGELSLDATPPDEARGILAVKGAEETALL